MIQRIQSIFLVLAATSGFGVLALPFATTSEGVQASALFSDKVYSIGDNIGLLVLFVLAGALSVAAIFLFKNRQVQMKIEKFALIADILGIVSAVVLFWQDFANIGNASVEGGLAVCLPFLFILFSSLALRAIKKDENLVRSADRLR